MLRALLTPGAAVHRWWSVGPPTWTALGVRPSEAQPPPRGTAVQIVDLPNNARVVVMRKRESSQDPALQGQTWVVMPQADLDDLLVRVLMAEARTPTPMSA